MKREKNEIIPIGSVIDKTPKERYIVKLHGTYRPIKVLTTKPEIKIEPANNEYDLKVTGTFYPNLKIIDDTMINLIKFNKEYYNSIIDGIKTQTLRKSNKRLQEEEIVKAVFPGTKNECYLQITNTGYKQFKYLNDEDARLEGYKTVDELKKALLKIYPRLDNFDRLYYYQFKVVDINAR